MNNLTEEIPRAINNITYLSTLNLSMNHLTGLIPEEIRYMVSLTIFDLSNNNLEGRIPTGGQFSVFSGETFAGNPKLFFLQDHSCKSNHRLPLKSTKIIVITISLLTTLFLVVITIYTLRKRWQHKSLTWKLTLFRHLNFKVDDVLKCLKEENIIGKGSAGIVYRGTTKDDTDVAIKRLVG